MIVTCIQPIQGQECLFEFNKIVVAASLTIQLLLASSLFCLPSLVYLALCPPGNCNSLTTGIMTTYIIWMDLCRVSRTTPPQSLFPGSLTRRWLWSSSSEVDVLRRSFSEIMSPRRCSVINNPRLTAHTTTSRRLSASEYPRRCSCVESARLSLFISNLKHHAHRRRRCRW